MFHQRSTSSINKYSEDQYLNPKKPQATTKIPQLSSYYKENFHQPQIIQTIRKRPQIFDGNVTIHRNISPLQTNNIQLSSTIQQSPLYKKELIPQIHKHIQISPQISTRQSLNTTLKNKIFSISPLKKMNCQLIVKGYENQNIQQNNNILNKVNTNEKMINRSTVICTNLEEELEKSQQKLIQLTQLSQQLQQQRLELKNNFKNNQLQTSLKN